MCALSGGVNVSEDVCALQARAFLHAAIEDYAGFPTIPSPMRTTIIMLLSEGIPLLVLLGVMYVWAKRRQERNIRPPVSEKMLRPPGESLRKKVETLNEQLLFTCMWIVAFPMWFLWLGDQIAKANVVTLAIYLCPPIIFLGYWIWRLTVVITQLANHQLGFNGERLVGEQLNELMLEGCYVYHDFPNNPHGNIDHVVVAPSGVYAIETKTRRKADAPEGKKEHVVIFDGKTLQFPHCSDSHGLDQAKANARSLGQFLSSATGERVTAKPILTFPGWWVESRCKPNEIKVLNPKQIKGAILYDEQSGLTPQQIKRICHQLDQRCRDVEF